MWAPHSSAQAEVPSSGCLRCRLGRRSQVRALENSPMIREICAFLVES